MSDKESDKSSNKDPDPLPTTGSKETASPKPFNPKPFLADLVGEEINVKLKWGMEYRGKLICADSYMNVQLENAEEYIDGRALASIKMVLIRCNNILYVHKFDRAAFEREQQEKEVITLTDDD
ncbi:putative small nuclear ribonucleoprotein F [Araneus ventricosus]|uniref:Sm protein F n=1 Tax=Araneus ventricosus TaxID=182803 RepID=A0A4Y2NVE3_ARAVE|nr:putative small nuclear ribonucleoprotein F [Araneus ventricosus]